MWDAVFEAYTYISDDCTHSHKWCKEQKHFTTFQASQHNRLSQMLCSSRTNHCPFCFFVSPRQRLKINNSPATTKAPRTVFHRSPHPTVRPFRRRRPVSVPRPCTVTLLRPTAGKTGHTNGGERALQSTSHENIVRQVYRSPLTSLPDLNSCKAINENCKRTEFH